MNTKEIDNPYLRNSEQPYVGRQDLLYQKRKKERDQEIEKAKKAYSQSMRFNPSQLNHQHQAPSEKHVTINDTASVATYEMGENSIKNDHGFHAQDLESDMNDREERSEVSSQQHNSYMTPQVQTSKSQKLLKTFNERTGGRSTMDYMQTPQMHKSFKPANPLMGESEGEYRRRVINDEYRQYIRKSMETSREERSTSKRMSRHLKKRQEANTRSPAPEPNIYSMKQRYKYSYFNRVPADEINGGGLYGSLPRAQSNAYSTLQKSRDNSEEGGAYFLKTDPMQVLLQQEVQKQQYMKELQAQMQENQERKQADRFKKQQYDQKVDQEIRNQNPYSRLSVPTTMRDDQGSMSNAKSQYQDAQLIHNQSYSPSRISLKLKERVNEPPETKNYILDGYEEEMRRREQQREEWRKNLESQKQEVDKLKSEKKMKKKMEEEQDEERIHRQLKEINDEFVKEKQSRASQNRQGTPSEKSQKTEKTPRNRKSSDVVSENHVATQRDNMKSQLRVRHDPNASFESNDEYMNLNRLRSERDLYDNQIDKSLKSFKQEAFQTQMQTNRALERLSQLQSEIQMKQRQNDMQSAEFFRDLMFQSKAMMASIKYQSPVDQILTSTDKVYNHLSTFKGKNTLGLNNIETEFMMLKPNIGESNQPSSRIDDPLNMTVKRVAWEWLELLKHSLVSRNTRRGLSVVLIELYRSQSSALDSAITYVYHKVCYNLSRYTAMVRRWRKQSSLRGSPVECPEEGEEDKQSQVSTPIRATTRHQHLNHGDDVMNLDFNDVKPENSGQNIQVQQEVVFQEGSLYSEALVMDEDDEPETIYQLTHRQNGTGPRRGEEGESLCALCWVHDLPVKFTQLKLQQFFFDSLRCSKS